MKRLGLILLTLTFPAQAQQPQPPGAPQMRNVPLSDIDIGKSAELFDIACKSGGLRVCQEALILLQRMQSAPVAKTEEKK